MLARGTAERPERVLQPGGQRHEALAAQYEMGVLEATERQTEVVEPVRKRLARHRDADVGHIGEVGEAQPTGFVSLAEDHLTLRPMQRPPLADTLLQRPPHPGAQLGMPAAPRRPPHG